jgi:hypothetical protein
VYRCWRDCGKGTGFAEAAAELQGWCRLTAPMRRLVELKPGPIGEPPFAIANAAIRF